MLLTTMKVSETINDPEDVVYQLVLRGKSTKAQTKELFDLFYDILTNADFQNSQTRVIEILKETKARYESMFRTSGHALAASRIGSTLTRAGYINEITGGVSHYFKILDVLEKAENDWDSLLSQLETIRAKILESSLIINLTGDKQSLENAEASAKAFNEKFFNGKKSSVAVEDWKKAPLVAGKNEGFAVPTQVNYVAKGGRFYDVGAEPQGADAVVRRVVSLDYLWNKVRVMGGAYGGSSQRRNQIFEPTSFRSSENRCRAFSKL